jgi:hypothetical protein
LGRGGFFFVPPSILPPARRSPITFYSTDMGHRIITRRRAALRATRFGGWDGGGGGKFKLASGV